MYSQMSICFQSAYKIPCQNPCTACPANVSFPVPSASYKSDLPHAQSCHLFVTPATLQKHAARITSQKHISADVNLLTLIAHNKIKNLAIVTPWSLVYRYQPRILPPSFAG